jgi:ABC-type phosphate transport system substrate-binding protein
MTAAHANEDPGRSQESVRDAIINSTGYSAGQKRALLRLIDVLESDDADLAHEVVYVPDNHGEAVAAVVPVEVATAGLAAVVALEDAADARAARAELARIAAGEPTTPWEQVKAELAELDS